jgi:hypothetical protein
MASRFPEIRRPTRVHRALSSNNNSKNNSMPQATAPTAPKTKSTTVLFTRELGSKNAVRFQEVPVEIS